MRKISAMILSAALLLGLIQPAFAAETRLDKETAGAYLKEQGIYCGDDSGDLMLDKRLTRAELATILTRLHGQGEVDPRQYTWACYYTDVPEWAKPYVGYCTANLLVCGYGGGIYGANDPVTPAAACTVVLRAFGYADGEGSIWNYNTACAYAVRLGIIYDSMTENAEITRGDMAILICRAMWKQAEPQIPPQIVQLDGITVGADGIIASKTITQPAWSRYDFSQEANPDIFTGYYTRAWYNALRQSIVDRDMIRTTEGDFNPQYLYAHALVPDQPAVSFAAFSDILGRIGNGLYDYALGAEPYTRNQYEFPGYAIVKVNTDRQAETVLAYIQSQLNDLAQKTDRDKVIALNLYLCSLMDYSIGKVASVRDIFTPHTTPVLGACSSYANAFSLLCDAAGIPCIIVSSANHSWNEVYVDGQWLTVDVASNDVLGGSAKDAYLLTTRAPGTDRMPAGTQFARELQAPGSTK